MAILEQFAAKWGEVGEQVNDLSHPFTDDDVSQIEDTFAVILPTEFVDQIKVVGAVWSPDILDAVCEADEAEPIDEEAEFDLHDLTELLSAKQIVEETNGSHAAGMPSSLLAIGSDSMGNKFCFDMKDLSLPRPQTAPIHFF